MKKTTHKHKFALILLFSISAFFAPSTFAYKVRIGTNLWVKSMAQKPETWFLTANSVDEVEPAFGAYSSSTKLTGTPNEGELSLSAQASEWRTIVTQFNPEAKKMAGESMMRTNFWTDYFPDRWPLPDYLIRHPFAPNNKIESYGCKIASIMIYDNAVNSDPNNYPVFNWTVAEIQELRDWMDNHNYGNVKIGFDARNFSDGVKAMVDNPLIEEVHLEADPELIYINYGNRKALLKHVWENTDKKIVFMIPVEAVEKATYPNSSPTAYSQVRQNVKWLGEFMGPGFLSSDRVVFYPTTYKPTIAFYPETDGETKYTNTITGITLSLIEQKELFLNGTVDPESYERFKQKQTISFPTLPMKIITDNVDFAIAAKVTSHLPLSYASDNLNVATIIGDKIHIVGVGTANITVSQVGTAIYNAESVSQTLNVVATPQEQTIDFPAISEKTFIDVDFEAATASSGLAVAYLFSDNSVASLVNGKIHIKGAGTCTVQAIQNGNAAYTPAAVKEQTLTVSKSDQKIIFYPLPTYSNTAADFSPAYASSALPITYTSSVPEVATISAVGEIHIVGVGTTLVTASQAGNANYNPSTAVSKTLVVKLNQNVNFSADMNRYIGEPDSHVATSSSGLPVQYIAYTKTIATVVSGKIHLLNKVGKSVIQAKVAETATYAASTVKYKSVNVLAARQAQTITFNTIPVKSLIDSDFSPASVSSGLPITYSSSEPAVATVTSAGMIHIEGEGTSQITANQVGSDTYAPAVSKTQILTVSGNTAVSDVQANQFQLFPNPATKFVTIIPNSDNANIEIFNSIGIKVYDNSKVNGKITIPSSLIGGVGMYFVNVNNAISKLIVK